MTIRCDDIIRNMHEMDLLTKNILSIAASAKVVTALIISDPDYAASMSVAEKAYIEALDTTLAANPTDYALLTYTLTVTAGANGSVNPIGSVIVNYGNGQSFTATPDSLYEVDVWTVDGDVAQTGGNSYFLSTIYFDHVVNVTFKLI